MTIVRIDSELYGESAAIALEIGEHELLAEMVYLPPVGTMMKLSISDVEWAKAIVTASFSQEDRFFVRFEIREIVASEPVAVH